MNEIVTITFNGVTAEIKPVQDGMYDLNDIWRVFKLPENKRPSEWKHRDKQHLVNSDNIRTLNKGRYGMTLATKKALFMYAAWCDYEFHDVVFSVFQLVTEGKHVEAAEKASSTVTQRTWLKDTHPHYMGIIRDNNEEGFLKLHPNFCYVTIMNLICETAFGISATKFKRLHGKSPRDACVDRDDIEGMERYVRAFTRVMTLVELRLSYEEIVERMEQFK